MIAIIHYLLTTVFYAAVLIVIITELGCAASSLIVVLAGRRHLVNLWNIIIYFSFLYCTLSSSTFVILCYIFQVGNFEY